MSEKETVNRFGGTICKIWRNECFFHMDLLLSSSRSVGCWGISYLWQFPEGRKEPGAPKVYIFND